MPSLSSPARSPAPERFSVVPLDAPGAERHGIGSLAPFADVLPFELFDSVDVAWLSRSEPGAGGDEIGLLASGHGAKDFEILIGLATPHIELPKGVYLLRRFASPEPPAQEIRGVLVALWLRGEGGVEPKTRSSIAALNAGACWSAAKNRSAPSFSRTRPTRSSSSLSVPAISSTSRTSNSQFSAAILPHPISLPSRLIRWNSSPRLRMQQSRRSARVRRSVSFVVSAAASSRAVGASFGSVDVVAAVTSFGLRPHALRLPSIVPSRRDLARTMGS